MDHQAVSCRSRKPCCRFFGREESDAHPALSFEYLFHSASTDASGASLPGRCPKRLEKKPELDVPASAGRVLGAMLICRSPCCSCPRLLQLYHTIEDERIERKREIWCSWRTCRSQTQACQAHHSLHKVQISFPTRARRGQEGYNTATAYSEHIEDSRGQPHCTTLGRGAIHTLPSDLPHSQAAVDTAARACCRCKAVMHLPAPVQHSGSS